MINITIVTPTYNRKKELYALFESLNNQTNYSFKWLIVDDGSTDGTQSIIEEFKNTNFEIEYIFKENGGKHTALNVAFEHITTDLTIIVDSDDRLVENAIEIIISNYLKYKNNPNICAYVYKKGYSTEKSISDNFYASEFIDNYNNYIINKRIKGDKAEVFVSKILKNYRYPEYKDEKFIGEGYLWSEMSRKYDMVFFNRIIYICEYLEGGLTNSGRKLRINNPLGGMKHANEYLDNTYILSVRLKNSLLYDTYLRFSNKKFFETINRNKNRGILILNIIPSYLLYYYWKTKFLKR